MLKALAVAATIIFAATTGMATAADTAILKGFYSFGADQTIADIGKVEWQPLKLEGLPPGVEIAMLRGDLGKGGGEILWLKGDFIYIAADGSQAPLQAPAYISLPGNTAHALKCGKDPCMFYLKYARPFDLHVHQMPTAKH